MRISDLSSVNIHWKMLTLARPANKMEEIIFTKFALMTVTLVMVVWTYECLAVEMKIMTTTIVITIAIVNNYGDNEENTNECSLILILTTIMVRLVQLDKQQTASRKAEKAEVSEEFFCHFLVLYTSPHPDITILFLSIHGGTII